jgi:tetratricopeptide (TPR) repeat protein
MVFGKKKERVKMKPLEIIIKGLGKHRRSIIGLFLVFFLITASLLTYVYFQREKGSASRFDIEQIDYRLREGIYQYRLTNYERAEIFFSNALEGAKKKKTKSLASFYLGNIRFRKDDLLGATEYYQESLSLDDMNIYAWQNAAVVSSRMGRWKQALTYAKKALELQEDFTPSLLFLGNLFYGMGELEDAEELYRKATVHNEIFKYNLALTLLNEGNEGESSQLFESLLLDEEADDILQGISAYNLGMLEYEKYPEKSADLFDRAMESFPANPSLRFNQALLLVREGQYARANELLGVLDLTGKGEYSLLAGLSMFKSGNYTDALDHWKRLYEADGKGWMAYVLGDIYFLREDLENAERYYREALGDQGSIEVYENLISIYKKMGDDHGAIMMSMEYAQRSGDSPRPLIVLADLYYHTGKPGNAKESVDRAVTLIKEDPEELGNVAALYKRHAKFSNALQIYHKILSRAPDNYAVYGKIAQIYLETGHTERAINACIKARDGTTDPDLYYRATLLLAQLKGGSEADEELIWLIDRFPYRYEAYFNRALLLMEHGEYEDVLITVQQCLDRIPKIEKPVLSNFYTLVGIAQAYLGNNAEASRSLKRARDLDTNNDIPQLNLRLMQGQGY